MKTRASICYYGDGRGNWIRRAWQPQCPAKPILMRAQCQGVLGHKGDHWCYAPDGSYQWSYNGSRKLRPRDAAGGLTPPGHREYPAPTKKRKQCYLTSHTDSRVTNPRIIQRLEHGRPPESWGAIDQPVKETELIAGRGPPFKSRRGRANLHRFDAIMKRKGGVPPREGDEA